MATIKDVARKAGVSTATVSYVLNNSAPISDSTRKRVLDAVAALGYRPSITARNLRASESRIIGYALHKATNPDEYNYVLSSFIQHMATTAEAHGYHLMTFIHPGGGDALDVYREMIETGRVDGFVISETHIDDQRIPLLLQAGFPFVAFGRANPEWDFPYVDVDGQSGIYQATRHVIDGGHRRVAFIGWPEGSIAGDYRYTGYCRAMSEAGLPCDPALTRRGVHGAADGYRLAAELLALPADQQPTAIVGVSDIMAIGAMRAVRQAGLRVGADVAVTGFDNSPLLEHLDPPLTSVRQSIREVARQLVELLLAQISGEAAERHVLVEPELIIRDSSR